MITLQNVSKYYYADTTVTQALRKVNLSFEKKEFVAITGESGSGKSTLLNIISGLDTFDEGEMYFNGEPTFQYDATDWEAYRRDRIGFVFQNYSLIGHYTTLDNIVSALLIQGHTEEEAKKQAADYLAQVGLSKQVEQKASELSSGQKQRLSIARALAKNTDIIVADEPTGNLDSETGLQIIQLLKKVSEQKLVIMVTHNYDQVESYVTRKVRLHDGELVSDVIIRSTDEETVRDESERETELDHTMTRAQDQIGEVDHSENNMQSEVKTPQMPVRKKGQERDTVFFFALRNILTQKGRSVLFLAFFLLTAAVSFVFMGELYVNKDDRITREYDNSAFLQNNDTRLVVRHPDGSEMTEADQKEIQKVRHVTQMDRYDFVNDVNYYWKEKRDYTYTYGDKADGKEQKYVHFDNTDHFCRSASAIEQDDLKAGKLPKGLNEIVVSGDESLIGTEQVCYFTADNIWGDGEYYSLKMKITGVLKEQTEQAYFSDRLCQMLTAPLLDTQIKLQWGYDFQADRYYYSDRFIPVIGQDLEENEIRYSDKYTQPDTHPGAGGTDVMSGQVLMGIVQGEEEISPEKYNPDLQVTEKQMGDAELLLGFTGSFSGGSGIFIEVSESLYDKLFQMHTTQSSAYISDYTKTDQVLKKLSKMGYEALSTYRVSTTRYVYDLVIKRLVMISISVLVLFVMVILEILILRSLMKIKKKEYEILKFMGMRMRQIYQISYVEMGIYCLCAVIVVILVMALLAIAGVGIVDQILRYDGVCGILAFVVYNMVLMILTVASFNRLLRKVAR